MAFELAKRRSVPNDSHNASTESSESQKVGTHWSSLSVTGTKRPESSVAVSGMSPMAVHVLRSPSIPATRSSHAQMFTRSAVWGWMCHVHPLSTIRKPDAALSIAQLATPPSGVAAGAGGSHGTRRCGDGRRRPRRRATAALGSAR
eukprot:341648-Pleurochrysis_carterae.AAC.1